MDTKECSPIPCPSALLYEVRFNGKSKIMGNNGLLYDAEQLRARAENDALIASMLADMQASVERPAIG